MTDLRADLIEAGARAWMEFEGDDWDAMGPKPQQALTEATERIFDAFLDTLADRADEWVDAVGTEGHDWSERPSVDELIAVLRSTEGET